ncbi:MAG: hypothetical protein U0172_08960 [Nitrospiraceae bacterium]
MTILLYIGVFVVSVAITLFGCNLFTNAIEWLGKRFGLSEGAVGSVLAAIGTTLPETSIPLVAIFLSSGQDQESVGLGAILGAPFMLSTLVIPILGGLLLLYAKLKKRGPEFHLNYRDVRFDLTVFLVGYGAALACAMAPDRMLHRIVAVLLLGMYGYYLWVKLSADGDEDEEGGGDPDPLIFGKKYPQPPLGLVIVQIVAGLCGLVIGAELFVFAAQYLAEVLQVSPIILALLIAPLATELPEMSNSFLWLYRKKDQLAVGNVTGAMVFQGTVPVAIGLLGTAWTLDRSALATMVLAVVAATLIVLQIVFTGRWRPWLLLPGAILYIGYTLYLYGT